MDRTDTLYICQYQDIEKNIDMKKKPDLPTPKLEGGIFWPKGVDSDQKGLDLFRNPSAAKR